MIMRRYIFLLGAVCLQLRASEQLVKALELKSSINKELMALSKDLPKDQRKIIYTALDEVGKLYDVTKSLDEKNEKLNSDYLKAKGALVTAHGALRKTDTLKKESITSAAAEENQSLEPAKIIVAAKGEEVSFDAHSSVMS